MKNPREKSKESSRLTSEKNRHLSCLNAGEVSVKRTTLGLLYVCRKMPIRKGTSTNREKLPEDTGRAISDSGDYFDLGMSPFGAIGPGNIQETACSALGGSNTHLPGDHQVSLGVPLQLCDNCFLAAPWGRKGRWSPSEVLPSFPGLAFSFLFPHFQFRVP